MKATTLGELMDRLNRIIRINRPIMGDGHMEKHNVFISERDGLSICSPDGKGGFECITIDIPKIP
jgi:hypothetical protein